MLLRGVLVIFLVTAAIFSGSCSGASPGVPPAAVCSFTVSPSTRSFASVGGSATVTVSAADGCAWSAAAAASWITVTGGATGSGSGSVAYTVTTNAGPQARSAALTIAGQAHQVEQLGQQPLPCTYELAPASAEVGPDGGDGSFAVITAAGCAWSAVSGAPWVDVPGGREGSGPGTVAYTVARHEGSDPRTATITGGGRTFTLRQSPRAPVCEYAVGPVLVQPCMAAGTGNVTITAPAGCSWTVTTNTGWLSVSSAGGQGSATIGVSYPENYDAPREGIAMVRWPTPTAGQNVSVRQAGCVYGVTRSEISMPAAAGAGAFDVLQQSVPTECGGATQDRCIWTATADVPWITIQSSMPHGGDGPVRFAVSSNAGGAPRTGRIRVRSAVVVIAQAGS